MSIEEDLKIDIINFFSHIENQSPNDKRETLKILMDKYIHLSKATYLMDHYDLQAIIERAKSVFSKKTFPCYLGYKSYRVYENDQSNLCVIEAVITHLNSKECLSKIPKFNYKEEQYE